VRDAIGSRAWIGGASNTPSAPAAAAGFRAPPSGERAAGVASSDWVFAGQRTEGAVSEGLPGLAPVQSGEAEARVRFSEMRLLGQLLATYLLLENDAQLLLVDQHAAHERVLYERIRAEWIESGVASQGLLVSTAVRLDPLSVAALLESRDALGRLGFDVEDFGENTVAVRSVPALLSNRDPAVLVRNLADALRDSEAGSDALRVEARALEAADRIFASLACHSARRKGDHLDSAEQRVLLESLDAIPWAPTCPHGRPVAVPIDLAEIERRFGRR
jgi:DNA mismatch repair protein MutL